jgi:ATP-binding cassette subfamily B protein
VNIPVNRSGWRSYAACYRDHRLLLFLLTLAGLAQSFSWVPAASILRRIFDQILPAGANLGGAVAELMGLQLAALLLAWWIRTTALRVSQDVVAKLRTRAIEHFYGLPRTFYTQADVEKLHMAMVYETAQIDSMNAAVTTQMLPGVCGALVLFWILARIEPLYAVVLAVVAPAMFVLNRAAQRHAWFRQEQVRHAWETFSRGIRFMIRSLDLTRSHAAEPFEIARQTRNIREVRSLSMDLYRYDAAQQALQGFLLMTCTLGALLAGGWSMAAGHATRGEVMVFYAFAALFAVQARSIVDSVPTLRRGLRAFHALDAFMRTAEYEPYRGTAPITAIETLRMEDAWFHYREDAPVLTGAAFEIRRGERIALIGANGSGKSTIAHLIAGFYRPERGSLSVNGVAYDAIDIHSLRARMAILPQNPYLFPGTVRENLTYGMTACDDRDLDQALEWSGAAPFVAELPEGANTWIGENGILLSGGQRQKLVLARALLRQPDFLLFDEPTNHLDEAAITTLLSNLADLPFSPAVLIVSHDPMVLRHVSRAWRLEAGCLSEAATLEPRW